MSSWKITEGPGEAVSGVSIASADTRPIFSPPTSSVTVWRSLPASTFDRDTSRLPDMTGNCTPSSSTAAPSGPSSNS